MSAKHKTFATFRKRASYKSEFDIFKQKTDIDLISLLSFDDDDLETYSRQPQTSHDTNQRPKTVAYTQTQLIPNPRLYRSSGSFPKSATTRRNTQPNSGKFGGAKNNLTYSKQNYNNTLSYGQRKPTVSARRRKETDIFRDFVKTSRKFLEKSSAPSRAEKKPSLPERNCRSSIGFQSEYQTNVKEPPRCSTTCEFRSKDVHCYQAWKVNRQESVSVSSAHKTRRIKQCVNRTTTTVNTTDDRPQTAVYLSKRQTNVDPNSNELDIRAAHPSTTHLSRSGVFSVCRSSGNSNEKLSCERCLDNNSANCVCTVVGTVDDDGETNCGASNRQQTYADGDLNVLSWTQDDFDTSTLVEETTGESRDAGESRLLSNDILDSKDSGIESNSGSPEFLQTYKGILHKHSTSDVDDDKHVKFQVENRDEDNDDDDLKSFASDFNEELETLTEEEKKVGARHLSVSDLLHDLERFGNHSRLSAASASVNVDDEANSIFSGRSVKRNIRPGLFQNNLKVDQTEEAIVEAGKSDKSSDSEEFLENSTMSKEARHAILETLNEMGVKKIKRAKDNRSLDIKHKSVPSQNRLKDNRSKYDHVLRERSRSLLRNQFKSLDSLGNEENSSQFSSPTFAKECDECSSEENHDRGKLFPSIQEKEASKHSRNTTYSSQGKAKVYNLEQAKKKNYKIPGIGNYRIAASPDDFEITPPGFDSRYNQRPFISKEEMETPPQFVRERSIQKCRRWLTNVNMSPLSLKPVRNTKQDNT